MHRQVAPFSEKSLLEIRGAAYQREHLKRAASGVRVFKQPFWLWTCPCSGPLLVPATDKKGINFFFRTC